MDWSEEEKKALRYANGVLGREEAILSIATRAVELAAARGGTMTAEELDTARYAVSSGDSAEADFTDHWGAKVFEHISVLGARNAVLEQEKANLEEGNRLLAERLSAAEDGNRELVRRAQQAEGEVESLKVMLKGSNERGKMLLDAKNDWSERARAAEARCATLSAAGQGQGAHGYKGDDDRDLPQREPHAFVPGECREDVVECAYVSPTERLACGWPQDAHLYPCSPTCTHDDAAKPGHPERVKERSEAFGKGRRTFKDAEEENVWADGWEDGLKTGEERGAEAMRAACWEAVRLELVKFGITRDEPMYVGMKSAIEGAVP